jgi:simple sugar transport system permease protein
MTIALQSRSEIARGRAIGIALLFLAGLAAIAFGVGSEGDATFVVTRDLAENIGIGVPASALGWLVAAVLAFFGGYQLSKGFGARINIVLAIGLGLFVIAFLAWAAAGQSFNMAGMLQESAKRAVPILFGALSGVLSERVAVINIGIEGMLLGGAFSGALFGSLWGATAGIIAATLTGGLLALVLAVLSIRYRVDQIIAGVVINIFVLGMTNFLSAQILVENPQLNSAPILSPIRIPLLADIPVIGSMFFDQNLFVYAALIVTAVTTFALFRTRWGLRARAVGEHPQAADTLGVNVFKVRYWSVLLSGLVAGFGGAYFTIGSVGQFDENMTAGRGFIGLAAMIFGRWHPVGALAAALVFGFADSMQIKLGTLGTPIPSDFLLMAPYVVTIIVVAGLVGKSRPPAADGQPYIKE